MMILCEYVIIVQYSAGCCIYICSSYWQHQELYIIYHHVVWGGLGIGYIYFSLFSTVVCLKWTVSRKFSSNHLPISRTISNTWSGLMYKKKLESSNFVRLFLLYQQNVHTVHQCWQLYEFSDTVL